jgi:hypothetical protein
MTEDDYNPRRVDMLNVVIAIFFTGLIIMAHYAVLASKDRSAKYDLEGAGPALIAALSEGWTPGPPPSKIRPSEGHKQ